ncbi:helix-turn-helix domain-containing protein [Blautia sp. HCP3S3_G3]|uniref:helix-turn-helix domain-containing protein n=1 Tax=Blautia sp. HCP3S3_G3 TaxID=3438913 RepID=UPI003F896875
MIELYKNIKELREQKGLSQDELAKLTGYTSRSSIAKIEKGEVDLTRSKIIAFAKALDTTPTQLMGWEKKEWDKESQQFEDKINALYYQLRGLGWTYEWSSDEERYILSNGITSIKITPDEYSSLVEQSEEFCRKMLQKLILKSSSLLAAAHERTDIEVTEDMRKHDDDIMMDDSEWE